MALIEIKLNNSAALGKMTSALALVPEGKAGPFPVFYLLHGLSDDHTGWVRRTSIELYVREEPMIVVMPNGERSWYTNAQGNPMAQFEDYITRELIGFVDSTLQTVSTRAGRAIGGLSMGGYGAVKLALKHPELFCAAASLSGALVINGAFVGDEARDKEMRLIFGEDMRGGEEDILAIAERADRSTLPAIRIDCGTEDWLLESNRTTHARFEELHIPHEYEEYPGDHNWDYWDLHIQDALVFIKRHLGITQGDGNA
ncbi:MAG: alpha/beta hydrolase family protein [Armatimonadota bacterium]